MSIRAAMASSSKMDEDPPEEDSDKDKKKKKEKKEKKDDGKKKGGKTKVKNEKKEKKDDKPSDEKKVLPKEEKDFDKFLKEDLHLEDEEEKKDKPASPVSRPYAFFLISGHGFVHATSIRRLCASFAAIGRSELAIRRPRAAPTRHRIL